MRNGVLTLTHITLSIKGYFLVFYIKNTLLVRHAQFQKKIKDDFSRYGMGMLYTYF